MPGAPAAEDIATESGAFRRTGTGPDLLATLDGYLFPGMVSTTAAGLGAEYAALVLVTGEGVWFRSRVGFPEAQTSREGTLWDEAMAAEGAFVVADLQSDPRFSGEPQMVGGIEARFFASSTFRSEDGHPIGMYCVASPTPMELEPEKRAMLPNIPPFIESQLAAIHELDRAAEVQRSLLPATAPPLAGYEVAGVCVAAKAVGGDFFDWYPIDGGMAFTLADVMGKGVGAGIIAATVRATIRTAKHDEDVVLAVDRAAKALEEDLSVAGSFVTLFHARLLAIDGHVSFVDAGHGLTVLVDAEGTATRLSSTDPPLGLSFGGDPRHDHEATLEPGATLVTFSDGVLDLYDGSLAAVDDVAAIVRRAPSAQDAVDEIERLARRDGAPDDVTVVVVRRLAI